MFILHRDIKFGVIQSNELFDTLRLPNCVLYKVTNYMTAFVIRLRSFDAMDWTVKLKINRDQEVYSDLR